MSSDIPSEGSVLFPDDVDLTDIFIGREQQLDQFRFYLERWQRLAVVSPVPDPKAPPSPNNKIQGFVVFLHGRGGFGKSTLLKRYREIATEYDAEIQVSDLIDWEFAAQEKRAMFNPAQGEDIDAYQYFGFMRDQFALALSRERSDFKEYQAAAKAVNDAKKQANEVLNGLQRDERFSWLREIARETLLMLVCLVAPIASVPLNNDRVSNKVREFIGERSGVGIEQLKRVWDKLHEKLGTKLNDYLFPAWRLGKSFGHDLAQFARKRPILIFFDTYEEIDEGDKLLQMIMGAAGGRVGWVIAGRDNLWAGVGQRRRSLEMEYGYRELVLADRRIVIDFSADGVGDFTSSDIEEYFTMLRQKARQTVLPLVTEKDAVHIRDVTNGVPLAVKIAAGLYVESQSLELIIESLDGKREIVDQMVERYLLHTRTNPADRARLYGLALLRRTDEQRALAAALDVPDFYDAELSRLHRRYGFIFTKQEKPALHQEVRHFLRLWLLQHRASSPDVMRVVQRLREALLTSFQELEAQRNYASLRERFEDEKWIELYLDLTEQQFWLDSAEGVSYILPFMFAASVYHREANREARAIGEFFQETLVQPFSKQWDWANHSLVYTTSRNPLPEELSGLKDLVRLASQTRISLLVPPLPEELEAALWWRLGEAYQGKSPNKSVYWYERAMRRLPHERGLREALSEALWDKEHATLEEEEPDESIALRLSGTTPPEETSAARGEGNEVARSPDLQRTLIELDRALEREPKSIPILTQRGEVYSLLREYRQAITDFDHALVLDRQNASLYEKRGEAYLLLREYRRAIADFDRALVLEPDNETIRTKKEEVSYVLKRSQQAALAVQDQSARSFRMSRRTALTGLAIATGGLIVGGSFWVQHLRVQPKLSSNSMSPTPLSPAPSSSTLPNEKKRNSTIVHRYTSPINVVAWSPDGTRIASGNVDGTVQIWDASTGSNIATYQKHQTVVSSVAWSPDGTRIASASGSGGSDPSKNGPVLVWNASNGKTLTSFQEANNGSGIAWSPDGTRIASASNSNSSSPVSLVNSIVSVLDVSTGGTLITYRKHTDWVNSVTWSPDGKHIASGGADKTVQVWDASTGATIFTYQKHSDVVYAVAWSPDGTRIASASYDKTVQVWDASTGANIFIYLKHVDVVYAVAWSPDSKRIASASYDTTVQIWDASTGANIFIYRNLTYPVFSLAWSPDGTRIASASYDKTVQVWDASTGSDVAIYPGRADALNAVTWSPDGTRIASALNSGRTKTGSGEYFVSREVMQVWDVYTGKMLTTFEEVNNGISCLAWSPDGKRIASPGSSTDSSTDYSITGINEVQIWDTFTGSNVKSYAFGNQSDTESDGMYAVAWSPDSKRIASASNPVTFNSTPISKVLVWDTATGSVLISYRKHTNWVNSVAWSPDGKHIASGSADKTVQVWDASTGATIFTYQKHLEVVNAVAWSPDGKHIASGSADSTVQVWDASTGAIISIYQRHSSIVRAVVWSPDGKCIASSSDDKTVQVWDASTGATIFTYQKHSDTVNAVSWSPNGILIASASTDKTVRVWQAPPS